MPRKGLQIGQNNISQSTAHDHGKTPGRRGHTWSLQWYANVDGTARRHMTKVTDATRADLYAAAHKRFEELVELAELPGDGAWTKFSNMGEFVRRACIPEVEENDYSRQLRPATVARYRRCLELYAAQTKGTAIADAIIPDALQRGFKAIARQCGNPTARQAAKVVSKYVMDVLVRKRVIDHNPLRPRTFEVTVRETGEAPRKKAEGGRALLPEERRRAVDYLLALDPASPARKRWSAEVMTAKRSCVIDMTLLQATCGLRIGEVRQLTRDDVADVRGRLTVTVTESVSKTHRARTIPVMDRRVATRVRRRLRAARKTESGLIFPRPSSDTPWDPRGAQKAVRALYDEMADALGIPLLREVSTHVWRATLNSEWSDLGVSAERRAAYFGHSPEVNRQSYTDLVDLSELEARVSGSM